MNKMNKKAEDKINKFVDTFLREIEATINFYFPDAIESSENYKSAKKEFRSQMISRIRDGIWLKEDQIN
jgi:hypothetical protein